MMKTLINKLGRLIDSEKRVYYYLILPSEGPLCHDAISDIDSLLVESARTQVQEWVGGKVNILTYDPQVRQFWSLRDGASLKISHFQRKGIHMLMNMAFLCSSIPPLNELVQKAKSSPFAICGEKSSRDVFAVSFSDLNPSYLYPALFHLTETLHNDDKPLSPNIAIMPFVRPDATSVENSPAMRGVEGIWCKRTVDSPRFVNTAVKEVLLQSQSRGSISDDPIRVARSLRALRDDSDVPWVFNTLLNEIEYRLGCVEPLSFPPEIHLSTTDVCNIECRFCSYTHDISRFEYVSTNHVQQMGFLNNIQALRLASGLGEPTMNPHLAAILEYISKSFPHIHLSLFTNGINLDNPYLVDSMIGRLQCINVSLNAATRASWKNLCGMDGFEKVYHNVKELHHVKKSRSSILPLVFGSMVLTRENIRDLPRMPALCRELGIDRFTGFPFSCFGYNFAGKYGVDMTFHRCRGLYDELYLETVREAEANGISLEIPLPSVEKRTSLGIDVRRFYDFAQIERNDWKVGRFLRSLRFPMTKGYCFFLWRIAAICSTYNTTHDINVTHYLYPCLGPLSGVDLSRKTSFNFQNPKEFLVLWQNPLFTLLRKAQHEPNLSKVCDLCRSIDTRDPDEFASLEGPFNEFVARYSGVTTGTGC